MAYRMNMQQQQQQQFQGYAAQYPPAQYVQSNFVGQQQQEQMYDQASAMDAGAREWNHKENETYVTVKARFCMRESDLQNQSSITVDCKGDANMLRQLVQHNRGAGAEISGNIHKGVLVNRIVVTGCFSTLPHPTGVAISDVTAINHIDGLSARGYSFIIPANLPHYQPLKEPIYTANKDAQGALAAKYGGLDFDKLKREIVQMSENSPNVYVPKTSIAVKAAMDAHLAIKISGSKSDNGKYRIDPKLEFIAGSNQLVEIEGKVSMATDFFNGFLRSVQENVMSVTKPVDLDCLSMTFSNCNPGLPLADKTGTRKQDEDETNAMHEVEVDMKLYFNIRQDV